MYLKECNILINLSIVSGIVPDDMEKLESVISIKRTADRMLKSIGLLAFILLYLNSNFQNYLIKK